MAISSPGIGSGLEISSIVSQLVAAQRQPSATRLDRQEATIQSRISALGLVKGSLSGLQGKLQALSSLSIFQGLTLNSSNTGILTATGSASAGSGTHDITVSSLAAGHALVTDPASAFANTSDAVGTGKLTFRFGTTDYDSGTDSYNSFAQNADTGTYEITIDATNNSLEGIKNSINNADAGVRASIVNNGSGYVLALASSATGAATSMEIVVDDTGDGNDTDTNGLSRLAFHGDGGSGVTNLQQTRVGTDAALTIDGVAITSASNTITDAIEGLTLSLTGAGSTTLTMERDSAAITNAVKDFIASYNALNAVITDVTKYDPASETAGALIGDAGVRGIASQMRNLLIGSVADLGATFSTFAEVGITTAEGGSLVLDEAKLSAEILSDPDAVTGLFAALGVPGDALVKYTSSTSDTEEGTYAVNITQLATRGVLNGNGTAALADDGLGTFSTAFVIDADNDEFTVNVDGVLSDPITLTQGSYTTAAQLVAEIQARINSDADLKSNGIKVTVSFDTSSDRLVLTSDRYGSASTVSFSAVDTNTAAELGLDTAIAGTDGLDVAGTLGGVAATGSGRFLTGTGDADGLKIEILGGATGARGDVLFRRGIADQMHTYLTGLLDNSILDDRIDSANERIDSINDQRERLNLSMQRLETRLLAQYTAMDLLVAELRSTGDFLTQQLASLPKISVGGS